MNISNLKTSNTFIKQASLFFFITIIILSSRNAFADLNILDFEEFSIFTGHSISLQDTSVVHNGFLLTTSSVDKANHPQYISEAGYNIWADNGTNYFMQYPMNSGGFGTGYLTIEAVDDSLFSFEAFDAAQTNQDVLISGIKNDGSTLSNQLYLGSTTPTYTMGEDWTDLQSISFSNRGNTNYIGLDNIKLNVSVVPEPVSSTLFIIGGATLGFRRFRKNFKKSSNG